METDFFYKENFNYLKNYINSIESYKVFLMIVRGFFQEMQCDDDLIHYEEFHQCTEDKVDLTKRNAAIVYDAVKDIFCEFIKCKRTHRQYIQFLSYACD